MLVAQQNGFGLALSATRKIDAVAVAVTADFFGLCDTTLYQRPFFWHGAAVDFPG